MIESKVIPPHKPVVYKELAVIPPHNTGEVLQPVTQDKPEQPKKTPVKKSNER
jgi:hypothetical protein